MDKKKLIMISIVVILSIFVIWLVIYGSNFHEDNEQYYFTWAKIENEKEYTKQDDILDKDKYIDNIVKYNQLTIDYKFFHSEKSIKGQVYIGTDKYLYISDTNADFTYRVSTTKFRTMYTKNIKYDNGVYIYLISEDNKLYYLELITNDIKGVKLNEVNTSFEVINFVNLEFMYDNNDPTNTLFVLCSDGNIYDVSSKIRYNETIKSLYSNLYVLDDNTMTNEYGKILEDKDKKPYKIKNIFETYDDNDFSGKNTKIIITEDNKLLYIDNLMEYVYEFNKIVKSVDFNEHFPYTKGKLKISFEDDSYVELTAECNEYFCVNDFVE